MFSKIIATLSGLAMLLLIPNLKTFAQCLDDTHSVNPLDHFESCAISVNPNSNRGASHWILYDLGYV